MYVTIINHYFNTSVVTEETFDINFIVYSMETLDGTPSLDEEIYFRTRYQQTGDRVPSCRITENTKINDSKRQY
jgi:hypothetical protein